ncbi:hypothetical protein [Agitococcus lubricus]|uniref:Tocopherol cyclase-like protein n=1 Tax=Agitococcus lubricus TaxID=1077255 RepID=A0A2T5IYH1_9GAMM|nr:hypothetical protein [Agitococcus lubricus]PTQ89033.1 hypothetical protein C8N29_10954 [Agitococcus lubricus]
MVAPLQIQAKTTHRGLYESFDFRGVSADERYAFILRHTFSRPWLARGHLEVSLLCFDRQTRQTICVSEQEELRPEQEKQLLLLKDWQNCTFSLGSGSFFTIQRDNLRGKLHTSQGSISWSLRLYRQDKTVHSFPPNLCINRLWPRQQVSICDRQLKYLGKIQHHALDIAGEFLGTNHHYAGHGYPLEYASAQGRHFAEDKDAYFYGLSSRLHVGQVLKTPYLSMASLYVYGRWYNFRQLSRSFRHQLEALDNFRWRIQFSNQDYGLEVDVNGQNPRLTAWAGWHVPQPTGSRVVVKATPFAQAKLTLYSKTNMATIASLTTQSMELRTLLPENLAEGYGFWVDP